MGVLYCEQITQQGNDFNVCTHGYATIKISYYVITCLTPIIKMSCMIMCQQSTRPGSGFQLHLVNSQVNS